MFVAGLGLLGSVVAPIVPSRSTVSKITEKPSEDAVAIESAGVYAPIVQGGDEALESGAWHRFPDRGNPVKGGTFILSAHSFVFNWNPMQTRQDSYFYNLNKTKVADAVVIQWQGKTYRYKVSKVYDVKPDAVEIEAPSKTARLVLYTCTTGGSADGRVVVEALPVT